MSDTFEIGINNARFFIPLEIMKEKDVGRPIDTRRGVLTRTWQCHEIRNADR
jgi:hypothetical protein